MAREYNERVIVLLTPPEREALDGLAARKFGGNVSGAMRAALALAVDVYADPGALAAEDPAAALAAYARAHKGK